MTWIRRLGVGRLVTVWLAVFFFAMTAYQSLHEPPVLSEYDDYSLPVASILHAGRLSVGDDDVEFYKELYPEWAEAIEYRELSGYRTRDGRELTWYFPVYAALCIPMTLLLRAMGLPAVYAFCYTNLLLLLAALLTAWKRTKAGEGTRALLVLALSLNPVVFYLSWCSGEVFLFAFLAMGFVHWYNRAYRPAAFLISVAGMANPVALAPGIVLIAEFLLRLWTERPQRQPFPAWVRANLRGVLTFAACFLIGLVPMAWNLYHTGHINLTATYGKFTRGDESALSRMLAYFFDLNYGLLPYFTLMLPLSAAVLIAAVRKKRLGCLSWAAAFLLTVFGYSLMVHINSGMSGMARYNVWGSVPLVMGTVLFGQALFGERRIPRRIFRGVLCAGLALTAAVVLWYDPWFASNTDYLEMTPVAAWTLDHAPGLYDPLHSTFRSRVTHTDGAYARETPVIDRAPDGRVRKLLASAKDREALRASLFPEGRDPEASAWLERELARLGEGDSYISVPPAFRIGLFPRWETGRAIDFRAGASDAALWFTEGLSEPEEWGTWTDGGRAVMTFSAASEAPVLRCAIRCRVFTGEQRVVVTRDGAEVFSGVVRDGGFSFDLANDPDAPAVTLVFAFPDAVSPLSLGMSADDRLLGIGPVEMTLTEAE